MRERKIIISRKGFDSSAGGKPSVVYNNRFFSFPIPEAESNNKYRSMTFADGNSMMDLFHHLGIKMFTEGHVDPDIRSDIFLNKERAKDWRGVFGQDDAAQTHLRENGVSTGDLFLFFGWFQHLEKNEKEIYQYKRFKKFTSGYHAIWGYMEVGEVLNVNEDYNKIPSWAKYHPHVKNRKFYSPNNTIYIAAKKGKSTLGLKQTFGTFKFSDELILSASKKRSLWKLPEVFKGCKMSYHNKVSNHNKFQSAGRGQEFITDATDGMIHWAQKLIIANS